MGPVQDDPLYDATCSVQMVPMLVQKTGYAERQATQIRPEESMVSRGAVFRGARTSGVD